MNKNNKKINKSISKAEKIQRSSRVLYDTVWNVILFFLVIGFIGLFFAGGIGAGYFASLVKDEPIRSYESMKNDIYNYEETSKLYFAGGKYFGDINSDLQRDDTKLDKISKTLIEAVLATEDEYFYEHKGVVPKAIIRAVVQEATNADMKTGGSTLTQQLIKLQLLSNEVSFDRKAKEILLALRLEGVFNKNEILEAYLNIIPYGRNASGRNIAGVQTAAKGIFGMNANEVNLAQAAFLAGLPQSPYAYTPFRNGGGLKDEKGLQPGLNRMKIVLKRMLDSEYINQKQYDEALSYNIVGDFVEKTASPIEKYPYLTYELEDRARDIIKVILAEEDGYTKEDLANDKDLKNQYEMLADRDLRRSGYNIHSTINKDIYDAMQSTAQNFEHYGPERIVTDAKTGEQKLERVQGGGSLIENNTGKIISFVGGRGYEREKNEINYINAIRPNGSTMKPLLEYAAAMESGKVQPGTPIPDVKTTYKSPGAPDYTPVNYSYLVYYGINSARDALAQSYNVSAINIYNRIVDENPAKNYLEKMGITTLEGSDYTNLNLAIGRPLRGIMVEENINAFTTFGNNGTFIDGYMIEKITTQDGKVIYEHEIEPVDVYSPQTTYLTIDMMRDVISRGTATYINTQLKHGGVDWAGKTGTSESHNDIWFVATNPNVTFGAWMGYDTPYDLTKDCIGCLDQNKRILTLWSDLVNAASDVNPELVAPQERFKRPEGIVERSYCAISGMLPSELCTKAGLIKSDLFNVKFVPTVVDDSLITGSYVTVNGKAVIAGPKTPSEFVEGDGLTFNPEFLKRNGYDKLKDISELYPRTTNRELWEKISVPSGELGDELKDDGKAPAAPTSLKASKTELTWEKSSSKDVVGYRIYSAAKPGANFKLIGSTSDTKASFSTSPAVFHVKAVDYFGLESSASTEIIVGEFKDPKDADDEKEKEKDKDKDKGKGKDKEKPKDDENEDDQEDGD